MQSECTLRPARSLHIQERRHDLLLVFLVQRRKQQQIIIAAESGFPPQPTQQNSYVMQILILLVIYNWNEKRSAVDVPARGGQQQIHGRQQGDGKQQSDGRSEWEIGSRQQISAQSLGTWSGQDSQNKFRADSEQPQEQTHAEGAWGWIHKCKELWI